jgi:flagellar hook-associated protein 3 FlgL
MRLTNKLVAGKYLHMLNKNHSEFMNTAEKVASQRKFLSVSEDPAAAMRAFQVRKSLFRNSVYNTNLTEVQGRLDEAENTVAIINDICKDALAQIMQGITGTSDETARKTVANTLRSYQTNIMNAANATFSGDYIFGGSTNDVVPFTRDANGRLLYKGQNVDTDTFDAEPRFVDIGIGLTLDGSGEVSADSAMNSAFSGAELLGTGVDANGITNNLFNLLGDIADKLESGDLSDFELYSQKFNELADRTRMNYVSIGEKSNFISYFSERLADQKLSESKKQVELEVLTIDQGAILYSERELAYDACLQIGTKILQPSLLDYLR